MTEFFQFFAGISLLSFLILAGGFIFVSILLEDEDVGPATGIFLITLAVLSSIFVFNNSWAEFVSLVPDANEIIPYLIVYLIVGLLWSFVKWASYLRVIAKRLVKTIEDTKKQWEGKLEDEGAREKYLSELCSSVNSACVHLTENNLYSWYLTREKLEQLTTEKIVSTIKFSASGKKELIIAWIVYWPISMCSVFINEFIVGLIGNIFRFSQGIYNKISGMMFASALSSVVNEVKHK